MIIRWWRRAFGGGPVPRHIHTVVTAETYVHDSCMIQAPFDGAEFVDFTYELWRDIYHVIWVIR